MKHKPALIIIISVLLLIFIGLLVFQPSYVRFDMPCLKMTKDGTTLKESTLLFTGLMYRDPLTGTLEMITCQCQIPDYQVYAPLSHTPEPVGELVAPGNIINLALKSDSDAYVLTACCIVFHDDHSCCVIYIEDMLYVGSASGDYDAALALFHQVVELGD